MDEGVGKFEKAGDVRARIIAAAHQLMRDEGYEATTTRAVAMAASVQAPTIYRLFGDKEGLLRAVAEEAFAAYVADKTRGVDDADPVEGLKRGWDIHVAFGVANPTIFALVALSSLQAASSANDAGLAVLRQRVRRVAASGRLRVSEERAVDLISAMGNGVIMALLQKPTEAHGDLSARARALVFDAILDEQAPVIETSNAQTAATLRAHLADLPDLSAGERLLMDELLKRIGG